MAAGGLHLDEVIRALTELGGVASFSDIRDQVTKNRRGDHSYYLNWENYEKTMRQLVHRHCEGYQKFVGPIHFENAPNGRFRLLTPALGVSSPIHPRAIREHRIPKTIPQSATPVAVDIAEPPPRLLTEIYRVLRDTKLAREVKFLHKFQCQICTTPPLTLSDNKFYAEVHHIRPLGAPHNGLDIRENVLCVCPNCHVLLDYGAIPLDLNQLNSSSIHVVGREYVDYHNQQIFRKIQLTR